MEASALRQAGRRGLLPRRSRLLKLQGDEKLVAMVRDGNTGAFEAIVDRYQGRLLGFCRQMLRSTEDAEDVLQEVFVNAYKAMLADNREINLRPWLYRIARNRCLNHLRKPTADSRESMDMVPMVEAASTAETVHNREEFRQLLADVSKLPETQRTALLLREMDGLSYDEISETMDTTVPSVKSLLVRARMSLSEASEARMLTCGEVRLALAEAAEGLSKASGPVRRHVRDCEECGAFRKQLRADSKALSMVFPAGPLAALKAMLVTKLAGGGAAGAGSGVCSTGGAAVSGSATATAGMTATAGAAAGSAGASGAAMAVGGSAAAGASFAGAAIGAGGGAMSSALGAKALAGVVTAAVITAGAVEVKSATEPTAPPIEPPAAKVLQVELPKPPPIVPPAAAEDEAEMIAVSAATVAPSAAEVAAESEATVPAETGPATEAAATGSTADQDKPAAAPELTEHPAAASEGTAHVGIGGAAGPTVPVDPDAIVIGAPVENTPTDPAAGAPPEETSPVPPPVDAEPVVPPPAAPEPPPAEPAAQPDLPAVVPETSAPPQPEAEQPGDQPPDAAS